MTQRTTISGPRRARAGHRAVRATRLAFSLGGVLALLAGCASHDALRSNLDERGRTWTSLDAAVTLARAAPRFSNAARDYLYVAPVESNNGGTRRHYLWVGLATTVDRAWPWAAPADAVTLLLTLDGTPLALPLTEWETAEGAALYKPAAPVYRVRRASVSLDVLERIAAAREVDAQVVASDGSTARYELWDGRWSDWSAFVVGVAEPVERQLGAAR
jgi:hypothetical protein